MSQLQTRLMALEKAFAPNIPKVEVLFLCAPGDGDPHVAWVLDGPNFNTHLQRLDGESLEEFEARVDQVHSGASPEAFGNE